MGLRLFFLPNFPGTTLIQGGTFIPDSRVMTSHLCYEISAGLMFCNLLKEGRNFVVLSHSDPVLRKEGTYYLDRLPLNFEVLKFLNPLFTLPLLVTNAA